MTYSPEVVEAIYTRYLDPAIPVKAIIAEFDLPLSASQLFSIFPESLAPDQRCRHCGEQMWSRRRKRSEMVDPPAYCRGCGHQLIEHEGATLQERAYRGCQCRACNAERQQEAEQAREQFAQHMREAILKSEEAGLPYHALTLEQKFHLLTLLNASGVPKSLTLAPQASRYSLYPTADLRDAVISQLRECAALVLDASTPASVFSPHADDPIAVLSQELEEHPLRPGHALCIWRIKILDADRQPIPADQLACALESDLALNVDPGWQDATQGIARLIQADEAMSNLLKAGASLCFKPADCARAREVLIAHAQLMPASTLSHIAGCAARKARAEYGTGKRFSSQGKAVAGAIEILGSYLRHNARTPWTFDLPSRIEQRSSASLLLFDTLLDGTDPFHLSVAAVWKRLSRTISPATNGRTHSLVCPVCASPEVRTDQQLGRIDLVCCAPGCSSRIVFHQLARDFSAIPRIPA
ncbi:hypothetical protein [Geopseudomonas aromaticivorans]